MRIFPHLSRLHPLNSHSIVVYTAICGKYDILEPPAYITPGCDYICFTDNPDLYSDIWKVVQIERWHNDPVRTCRRIKVLLHRFLREYKISVWVDANTSLKTDLRPLIDEYLKNDDIACFEHSERDCIYDEALTCIDLKKDSETLIRKEMDVLRSQGYPSHSGLIWSGILFRRHDAPLVVKAMNLWWKMICRYSRRDQLAFNYVAWKCGLRYHTIHQNMLDNDIADYRVHDSYYLKQPFSEQANLNTKGIQPPDGSDGVLFAIDSIIEQFGALTIEGWAFICQHDPKANTVYLQLQSDEHRYVFSTFQKTRPDLESTFGKGHLLCGFFTKIRVNDLAAGSYHIGLLIDDGEKHAFQDIGIIWNSAYSSRLPDPSIPLPAATVDNSIQWCIDSQKHTKLTLQLSGWAFVKGAKGRVLDLLLLSPQHRYFFAPERIERPDLPLAFPGEDCANAGFFANFNETALAPGLYRIGFFFDGETPLLCFSEQTWDIK